MLSAIQLASDELHGASTNLIPQISTLLQTSAACLGERVSLAKLQVVTRSIKGYYLVKSGRIRATFPRDIFVSKTRMQGG